MEIDLNEIIKKIQDIREKAEEISKSMGSSK